MINYDLPNNREQYIHRIGRSGRYGRKARALASVGRAFRERRCFAQHRCCTRDGLCQRAWVALRASSVQRTAICYACPGGAGSQQRGRRGRAGGSLRVYSTRPSSQNECTQTSARSSSLLPLSRVSPSTSSRTRTCASSATSSSTTAPRSTRCAHRHNTDGPSAALAVPQPAPRLAPRFGPVPFV